MYYIDSLQAKGFRNYRHLQLEFHPRLNLIVGDNAQGKTNLLESIYYLSVTRSFRTSRDHEMANWEDNYFFIKGCFVKDEFKNDVHMSYRPKGQLKVSINSKQVNRYDHLQQFPVVVFSPDDLLIIREGPSIRRRFINLEASRLSLVYFKELRAYQRVILQRNHLLKQNRNRSNIDALLEPWDKSLVEIGSSIIFFRLKLIGDLEKEAKLFFDRMTCGRENITLCYSSTVEYQSGLQDTKDIFKRQLKEKREQELKRGSTAVGPHLDDIKISINDYDTRYYSSQGQKRTAALALKMAEVILFKKQHGDCPIIILDDVFSEFDNARKKHLLEFLNDHAGQYFISAAVDSHSIAKDFCSDHKIFKVDQGSIRDETTRFGS